ncbi:ABC transporter ATP-binding protein [Alkalibacterium thalassium]|uniref:Oligopeptide transport system ATP-binding protein n=1 Tax=Alkalibacterium thalassium TaxID=426701 RepID=A0A1G9B7R6_9LACT|nr:ATP-binding cassette domain-containing protein [Alkalibacterium thalassium]SDK34885.1 oligopeptide transport system ATP-binding protein [Alkalibacterium thalassium]
MYFPLKGGSFDSGEQEYIKAVDDVTFSVYEGETLGIVGESGSGKTTLGRTMIRLNEPTAGEILYEGEDISNFSRKELTPYRKDMQIIFQDPYSSLDPRMTVGEIIEEPLVIKKKLSLTKRTERVKKLMEMCGLNESFINRYPHEFSGGQRQRIGIARSLALNPKMIVCDEAVSALDVSIQSQIMNLLLYLQRRENLTYVFISHNLKVVYHMSDRIAVMYHGKIVELADREELYFNPIHDYTKSLLKVIPNVENGYIAGGSQINYEASLPDGYSFTKIIEDNQALYEVKPGHYVYCYKK